MENIYYSLLNLYPNPSYFPAMNLRQAPHKRAPQNDVLEEVFSERKNLNDTQIHEKAMELSMTERQVERWLRQRKLQDRPTTLEKFSETG